MASTPIITLRWLRISLILLAASSSTGCAIRGLNGPCATLQRGWIYRPHVYPTGNWAPSTLNYEDTWFVTEDGVRLHGWYIEHENPQAVILLAHGRTGNIATRIRLLEQICNNYPVSVFAFDYRGFGRSAGVPTEAGLMKDVRAARYCVARRTGLAEQDIVLMGQSLGGGVVVETAVNDGARGMILLSTFTSVPDVVESLIPFCCIDGFVVDHFDSYHKIEHYYGPLLSIHGDADRYIPFEQGWELFKNARGPKQFVTIVNGDHKDIPGPGLAPYMHRFLNSLPPISTSDPSIPQFVPPPPEVLTNTESPGPKSYAVGARISGISFDDDVPDHESVSHIQTAHVPLNAAWKPKWAIYGPPRQNFPASHYLRLTTATDRR